MFWEFFFLNLIWIALALLLYIVLRTIPRLDERPVKKGVMERWLTSELPGKIDALLHTSYLRTLRRIKVFVMRADNSINKKLESVKLERGTIYDVPKVDLSSVKDKPAENIEEAKEVGEETGTE